MIEKIRKLRMTFVKLLFFTLSVLFSSELLAQQASNSCTTMPEPVTYMQVSKTNSRVEEYATIRGVRVTRIMTTRGNPGDVIMYSDQDTTPTENYCSKNRKTTFGSKKYPFMDSNKVFKIVYQFSKPVNDVEVFLAAFGYNGARESWKSSVPHLDVVEFSLGNADGSVYNGEMQLIKRSDCGGTTSSISGGTVSSQNWKTTDLKIGITSSTPFTKLTLDYKEPPGQTGGYGFFPEICLASVVTPITGSTCVPPSIGDPFTTFPTDTKTINGISVKRTADSGITAATSFPGSHCGGSAVTYPSKDPLLQNSKKIVYEFGAPMKSAEIFLMAFGDNTHVNTFDKAQFDIDGGGTISLSKTYDCNPITSSINGNIVTSVSNRKLTTDVAIKITSDKPFTKITITDKASTGFGYLVALCPSSVIKLTQEEINNLITIDPTDGKLLEQSVCDDDDTGMPPSYKAKATTPFGTNGTFDYSLEVKKKNGSWQTESGQTRSNIVPGSLITYTPANFGTIQYDQAMVRVKYVYKNPAFPGMVATKYSNEVKLNVDKPEVTGVTASPTSVAAGVNTNVTFTISGTAGAVVTYTIGGATKTATIQSNRKATVTESLNQAATLKITKVKKGACDLAVANKQVQVTSSLTPTGACTTLPAPEFPSGTTKKTMGGIEVTIDRTSSSIGSTYNPAGSCKTTYQEGYTFVANGGQVKYKFSQPVNDVEVWFALMSHGSQSGRDTAKITTNCGSGSTPTLTLVADCKGNGKISQNTVYAEGTNSTDLAVKVHSDKAFTELIIDDVNSQANGYLVELCAASVKKQGVGNTDIVGITTQLPATTKICVGTSTTLEVKATLASNYTGGTITYQWEESTDNGTTWNNVAGASGTVASGAKAQYIFTPTASHNNRQYRVKYTYTNTSNLCGSSITYSEATKINVVSPSDVITINTPNYSNISNVCTETKTIQAKATIASAYAGNIKNAGGGNYYSYELQYKANASAPWENYRLPGGGTLQTYSNNANGRDRTFTINPANVESGATFRVKYTASITTLCDDITVYSNEFTFTKKAPTTITTQPIAPATAYCKGATATALSVVATGDGTLTYQWYSNTSNNNTGGTPISTGGTLSTYTPNTGTTGITYYYVKVTGGCGVVTSTPVKVEVSQITPPSVSTATKTECPTATTTLFDMASLVTPGAGYTLKWYDNATGGTATTTSPKVDRKQTAKHTVTKYVSRVNAQGCESDRVSVTYIVDIASTVTPTVTLPSTNLVLDCRDGSLATKVNTWLNSASASTSCGVATLTNNYNAVRPSDLCSASEVEVTFTATDAFGKTTTAKKKIKFVSIVANNDTATVARSAGGSIDVLANDRINGQPATTANATVVITNANGSGATVNSATGKITIPAGSVLPATYNIKYKICDKVNTSICSAEGNLALTVTNSSIVAANDTAKDVTFSTSEQYVKVTGGTSDLNILDNDKLGATTGLNTTQVDIIPTNPTGIAIETTTGKVKVAANTPAGTYEVKYKIKEKGTNNESTETSFTVIVRNAVQATSTAPTHSGKPSTTSTPTDAGSILGNIKINGNTPAIADVTITSTPPSPSPGAPSNTVPSINTTTGKVEIPKGTPSGTYTIPYTVCDKATPSTCTTANAKVTVTDNTITAGADTGAAVEKSATSQTMKNAAGTSDLNVLDNDTLGTTTGLDNTQVQIITTVPVTGISIDSDGKVNVAPNTPVGTHTIKYKIKEIGTNNQSAESTLTVVVKNKVTNGDDTYTGAAATSPTQPTIAGNVLNNIEINGVKPPMSDVTLRVVTPATGTTIPRLNVGTGNIEIPQGTPAGTYTIKYEVCDKATPKTCKQATATVKVGANTIVATSDDFSNDAVTYTTSAIEVKRNGTAVNVLSNDTLAGIAPTTTQVDIVEVTPSDTRVTITPSTGRVTVAANTPAGTYTIDYKIAEKGNATNKSAVARVTIVVKNKVETNNATSTHSGKPSVSNTPTDAGSILGNVKINGNTPPIADVTITSTPPSPSPGAPSTTVPRINTSTGKVEIPKGTPSGTYTIPYTVCDKATPSTCTTASAKVTVNNNTIDTTGEDYSSTPAEKSATATTLKNASGQEVNVLSNDTLEGIPVGSLTTDNVEIVNITPSNPNVTIDPATGKVTIAANTPAGTYTIKYKIKDKGTDNISDEATVTVGVKNKVTITRTDFTGTPSTNGTPTVAGNILTNTNVDGSTPTAGNVTITVPNPATGATTVPRINTTTGNVEIPQGTPAGNYTITYQICDKNTPAGCATQTTQVTVTANTITAVADNYSIFKVEKSSTTSLVKDASNQPVNVLSNDILGSVTGLNTTQVEIIDPSSVSPIKINTDGTVAVLPNTAKGTYTLTYKIKEKGTSNQSATPATVTVVVINKVEIPTPDVFTGTPSTNTTPNVIGDILTDGNAKINGTPATIADVTITVDTPATAIGGAPIPAINTATGKVEVPQNTPDGNYTIVYTVCDKNAPVTCKQATATIKVGADLLVANDDNQTNNLAPVERATTASSVKDTSGNVASILTNDKKGSRTGLDNTVVTINQTVTSPYLSLNTTTGAIEVAANTPAGQYTIKYTLTDKANVSNISDEATVSVIVKNKVEVDAVTITPNKPSATDSPREVGDILDGVKVNGVKPNPSDVTITVTNPATSVGGAPVPEIDEATGKVTLPKGVPSGTYSITYEICDNATGLSKTCKSQTVNITVNSSTIQAQNDEQASSTPFRIEKPTVVTAVKNGGSDLNILDNDKLNERTGLDTDVVTLEQVSSTSTGVNIDTTTGKVFVSPTVSAGSYLLTYKITETGTSQSSTAQVRVAVVNKLENRDATYTGKAATNTTPVVAGNVLTNVKINGVGNQSIPTDVTVSVTTPATPIVTGAVVPTIDTTTGEVRIPQGTPAGNYTIAYEVCNTPDPQAKVCQPATATVTVGTNTIDVQPDAPSNLPTTGGTVDVLSNDKINNIPATTDNVKVTITDDDGTGATVDADGKINVPSGVAPGEHTITYTVCEKNNTTNCQSGTIKVVVPSTIEINSDGDKIVPSTGGTVDVLTNDKINNIPATTDNVTINITNDNGTGATIDADGKINVPGGLTPGEYTITYKVCDKNNGNTCQTGSVKVVVPSTIEVNPDGNRSVPSIGGKVDVLGNDKINGNPATKDNVIVTITNDDGTGATVDADGKINVPSGVTPGEHTITYTVCDKNNTNTCETGTLKVVVPSTIVVTPDTDATVPSTGGKVDVLGNDTINGTPATKDNVTITITDDNGTGATIDADGKINVPSGITPGEYTITYKVCDKNNGNTCQTGSVKVVVPSTIEVNPDGNRSVPSIGGKVDVLGNDKINGNPATTNNVIITITDDDGTGATIDPDGKINVPGGLAPGEHTITYTVCDRANPTNCQTGTVRVVITTSNIQINPDGNSTVPSTGGTVDVLSNDTINGTPATTDNVTIAITDDNGTGATIDADGKINVPGGLTPGEYNITYKVCDKANSNTCETGTVKVVVPSAVVTIAAQDDGTWKIGTLGGLTPSVLDNDTLGTKVGLSADDVKVEFTTGRGYNEDRYLEMNSDGRITVKPNAPLGIHRYYYTIIDKTDRTRSAYAIATIEVVDFAAAEDVFDYPNPKAGLTTPSVLANDEINGRKNPTIGTDVTFTPGTSSNSQYITMDAEGKITIAPNTPNGTYTHTYEVCKIDGSACQTATATIRLYDALEAKNDDFSATPVQSAVKTVVGNVLNNTVNGSDSLAEEPITDTSLVQLSIVTDGGLTGVELATNGDISVPQGAPSGTYIVKYRICQVSDMTNCKEAIVTIVVANDTPLKVFNAISGNGDNLNDGFIIEGIEAYPKNTLKIFNRWGVLVYEKEGYSNSDPFKGYANGKAIIAKDTKLPQGTYYYILEYVDGNNHSQQKSGWLYLKE